MVQGEHDYWLDLGPVADGAHCAHPLKIEQIHGIEPLDAQLGVWPKRTVPEVLSSPMFGTHETRSPVIRPAADQVDPKSSMQTYAILDASKVPNLTDMLAVSELEHRCLFKGRAFEELKEVAPWLVRLEGDNSFTRNLFTRSDAAWHLWDNEPGIYFRSCETLEDVWRHLRKFTRIQDPQGKWYHIRFYDPAVALGLFSQEAYWKSMLDSRVLASALVLKDGNAHIVKCNQEHEISSKAAFDFELERRAEIERKLEKNTQQTISILNIPRDHRDDAARVAMACMRRMMTYGFTNSRHLRVLAAWELSYGIRYEEFDPEGTLLNICQSKAPAIRRFKKFQKRMDEMSFQKRIT
ncbi:uncharacterized protein DUF4123 [Ruegeria sp. P4]|nr:uncharacterized protein DUF4123 [Ruegeria sp. P4]